jgi:multiple sugar transport system permease protein
MNQRQKTRKWFYHLHTFSFLAPWLSVFILFHLYPIGYSLYLSFTKYRASGVSPPRWVGLQNYIRLLEDSYFLNALKNSFFFVIGTVPLTIIIALSLAALLHRKLRFHRFYQAAYFMPVVTTIFVTSTIFIELYSPTGIFNQIVEFFGGEPIHWLRNPNWALRAIMLMNIWASFGFYCLIFLAGLQNIPKEYYEASQIEGASNLRQFFTITIPLLKPMVAVCFIINIILAFQVFGEIYIMTKGGPFRSSETAVYYLYNSAFHKQKMGYAAAAGYYIFLILLILSFLQLKLSKKGKRAYFN